MNVHHSEHDDRWLHDIDPPLAHRGLALLMFALVCLTVGLGIVVGLGLQDVVAERVATLVSR